MMAIQSPEDFLSILEKSNLLNADQLLAARQSVEGLDDATLAAKQLVRDGVVTRWQAAQLLAGRSSFLLGKYKLIDLLGRGGMGRVFLGRHVTMQRQVALKIVSREIAGNPASLERFLAEARAIAALDHPAIVQAYSVDSEGDRYYIVMEYVDGRDLQRVVEEDGPLHWQMAAEYIRQAADGLAHAHGRNLVHCDIKPSNLLVNSQGQVKILDMGMARLGGGAEGDAEGGEANGGNHILGSVDYLAPEQAMGSDTFDHRADLYSLGCTLYFLLTGHPPFPEGTLPERILKHQTQQPRPIPTERPDVPPPLVQICRRMMAKEPAERFQSADEVVAALAELPAAASASARASDDANAKPAPAARAAGERSPADMTSEAAGIPADPRELLRHWLASTPGRFVLGGVALLVLAVVAGVSMAIVAARGPAPSRLSQDDTADTDPAVPVASPAAEEPKDEDPFDLARAFADRVKAGKDGSEAKPPDETTAPTADPVGPSPPPEQPAPEQPATEPAPSDPKPDKPEPATDKPTTDEPKPDKPTTDKPKPDKPKPSEKPKPQNTLRDVAKTIAMDAVAKPGAKASLGKLQVSEATPLRVELLGGQTAWKGGREYVVEQGKSETGADQWIIRLHSEAPGAKSTTEDIAKLDIDGKEQDLRIEWLAQASIENIQPLRNCAVALHAGSDKAWLEFGTPEPAEPIVLDFAKRPWRATFASEVFPTTDSLGIQVTRIEGNVPKLDFKPADTVKEGQRMEIHLAKQDTAPVKLNVSFVVRGRVLKVEALPMFAIPGVGEWPLSPRDVQRVGSQLAAKRSQLDLMWKALPEKERGKVAEERDKLDKIISQVVQLVDFQKELNEQAKIHFRVFTLAGDRQVDLWTTDGVPAPASGASGEVLRGHQLADHSAAADRSRHHSRDTTVTLAMRRANCPIDLPFRREDGTLTSFVRFD